jgi:hypothetical protein
LEVPIFQRSRPRERVVPFFIRPDRDRPPSSTSGKGCDGPRAATTPPDAMEAIKKLVDQRGCAWRPCIWLEFPGCQRLVAGRYSDFKKRVRREGRVVEARFKPLANDVHSLRAQGGLHPLQKPCYSWPFQDLQHPSSEFRNLQDDHGGGAESGSTSARM